MSEEDQLSDQIEDFMMMSTGKGLRVASACATELSAYEKSAGSKNKHSASRELKRTKSLDRETLHILEEIALKFIVSMPSEDYDTIERLFFQIEESYWHFVDNYNRTEGLQEYCTVLFCNVAGLKKFAKLIPMFLRHFHNYKNRIPVYGAMIFNAEHTRVLMVKGYNACAKFSFPKGKVNKDELPKECAVREVFEETGCDLSSYITDLFVESKFFKSRLTLFVVDGVPEDYPFATQTKMEIRNIEWVNVLDIIDRQNPETVFWADYVRQGLNLLRYSGRWLDEEKILALLD